MKQGRIMVLGAALLLALGLALPTSYAGAAENVDIVEKLKTAKTASDHEAIASYYEAQATDAKKKAALHREMAATYTAGGSSLGKGSGPVPLPQHCTNLAKEFDEEASHYTAMAEAHRQLAKAAK
jgi:hypothetical protein